MQLGVLDWKIRQNMTPGDQKFEINILLVECV